MFYNFYEELFAALLLVLTVVAFYRVIKSAYQPQLRGEKYKAVSAIPLGRNAAILVVLLLLSAGMHWYVVNVLLLLNLGRYVAIYFLNEGVKDLNRSPFRQP